MIYPQPLTQREWKRVRMRMLQTGEFDPNIGHQLSKEQKFFINQCKLTLRDLLEDEETNKRR